MTGCPCVKYQQVSELRAVAHIALPERFLIVDAVLT